MYSENYENNSLVNNEKQYKDQLDRIYYRFLMNSTHDTILNIASKLVSYHGVSYNDISSINDDKLNTKERANKLFDFVYKSHVSLIEAFFAILQTEYPLIFASIHESK